MPARPVAAGARLIAPDHLPPAALSLLQLGPRACRWPIGEPADPGFRFCSVPRLSRGPYCAVHRVLARELRR